MSRTLTEDDVLGIVFAMRSGMSRAQTAEWYGTSKPTVSSIMNGRTWSHLTSIAPAPVSPRGRHGKHLRGESNPCVTLDEDRVMRILAMERQGVSRKRIAAETGACISAVRDVLRGRSWAWLTGRGQEAAE